MQFPEKSLFAGLKELNLTPDEIDYWVFQRQIISIFN